MICPVLSWPVLTWPSLAWLVLSWLVLIWPVLTWPNIFQTPSWHLHNIFYTPSRNHSNIFQTPSRDLPEHSNTFQTPSRYLPDTIQTPPRHFQTISISLKTTFHNYWVTRRVGGGGGGGWVGGLQVHNHAPSGPNLQVRTCKNSSQVEFQVGPEYGNNLTNLPPHFSVILTPLTLNYKYQTGSRIFHTFT